jgi:hypothetical protein
MNEQIKRLEAQVTEGKVKAVNAAEVSNLLGVSIVLLFMRLLSLLSFFASLFTD